ncbi:UNVERIFIED_CONTAM: hypothetical protein Scaly_0421500 [Sesamum calycinum]|uniref:AB hydrolase-1 domain-containing protein n=1 Tax=Sesamum calycinum TaxID=2727403 RepID=A0AAW2SDW9_9LAMI
MKRDFLVEFIDLSFHVEFLKDSLSDLFPAWAQIITIEIGPSVRSKVSSSQIITLPTHMENICVWTKYDWPYSTGINGGLCWLYLCSSKASLPKICGSPGGPPVTSPRVRLGDGRHLAYKERGLPKEEAKHKIIVVHAFGDSKGFKLPISDVRIFASTISIARFPCFLEILVAKMRLENKELLKELEIYLVAFDRAGYGESDPNPKRSVKSDAFDIQELADKLQLGPKFYAIGISLGAYPVYGCLKYIPHRLLGAALVVPVANYWWRCFPAKLSKIGPSRLLPQNRWAFTVAHYAPWLLHWWLTQKWIPSLSNSEEAFSPSDVEILRHLDGPPNEEQGKVQQQGAHESLHRDLMVSFGKWEFEPIDISNPFPNNEGFVHMWQGCEDKIFPFELNRYIAERLPWIQYHEVADAGHLLIYKAAHCEAIFRALVSS